MTHRRGILGSNPTPIRADSSLRERHWTSRWLHRAGATTAHSGAGLVALLALAAWFVVGVIDHFSHRWEIVLYSATASVTFLMVFVIQHTQARQTSALQRKLDELIRASGEADPAYIAVESASDGDLERLSHVSEENAPDRFPGEPTPRADASSARGRPEHEPIRPARDHA
ncbi:MAG: low affinity iron permease family protein [Acidimicrobiales bacterium]